MRTMAKRARFIVLGMLIFMCMGTIYSWSVFRKPLEAHFGLNAVQSGLPYMVFLAMYAITMPFAGKHIERIGPRWIVIIGGLLVGIAWLITGFAPNITFITLTYGIIGGAGVGIAYGAPLVVAAKWFPDKKGFAMGLTLLGFGFSPFVTAPVSRMLIEQFGPFVAFRILGGAFLVIITAMALPLRLPSSADVHEVPVADTTALTVDYTVKQMITSKRFIGLWSCYVIGAFTGLTAIAITSPFAQEVTAISAQTAALLVSFFAIFNGIGRPIFGSLTDKIGVRNAAFVSFGVILLASILARTAGSFGLPMVIVSFASFWMILGGWLAIAPTATARLFGQKNYSHNYGFVFTAYGCAAILGVLISGEIRTIFGSYLNTFYVTGGLAVAGCIIAALTLPPKQAV